MKPIARWIAVALLFAALPVLGEPASDPQSVLTVSMKNQLAAFKKRASDPSESIQTREFTNCAFLAMLLGDDGRTAEDFLDRAFATQNMRADNSNYGQLRWTTGDLSVTDLNAIEFGAQALGPLLLNYSEKLSPDFMDRFRPHLSAAMAALQAHDVPMRYTNIFLMKTVNLMLLGEATGDDAAVQESRKMLDAWIDYTKQNGIHEFDSPTYYGPDLNSLVNGYHYAADAGDREKFRRILDYYWTDIAANYFAPAQKISAPYSRDYDFLAGSGILDIWLAAEGWTDGQALKSHETQGTYILDNFRTGGYRLPDSVIQLAHSGPREVVSSWDEDPNHIRWAWLGRHVAMGSTSGNYDAQDKLFGATFAGPQDLPQVTLVADTHDSPYGFRKEPDSTGHMKPVHLPPSLGAVQSGGIALLTLDIDPSQEPRTGIELSTNILLPIKAAISVDGQPVTMSDVGSFDVKPSGCVTAGYGGGFVSIRLIEATALPNLEPSYALVCDQEGKSHGAIRLKLTSVPKGQRSNERHLRMAFLVIAADADPTDQVTHGTVQGTIAGDRWTVSAQVGNVTLEIVRSASDRNRIIQELINGQVCPHQILSINGKEMPPVGD